MSDARNRRPEEAPPLQECVDCLEPAEAFSIIGSEIRLTILEELWQAESRPVSFSELRRRVGMSDSAQFNYHLDQLRGQFVRKTDSGYEFRQAGLTVVHAILSGSFNENPSLEPFAVGDDCPHCGASLEARYEDDIMHIECTNSESRHVLSRHPFPPGGFNDRTRDEALAAYDQRVRHLLCLAVDGVCWTCNGTRSARIVEAPEDSRLTVQAELHCDQCRHTLRIPVGLVLLDDAATVTFFGDHGIDLNARPHWTHEWAVSDVNTEVLQADPYRVAISIELEDESLRAILEPDLTVGQTERHSHDGAPDAGPAAE
ncbi:MAG: ArsR family transcriptional regulator [Halobacteriaceae archaeon]